MKHLAALRPGSLLLVGAQQKTQNLSSQESGSLRMTDSHKPSSDDLGPYTLNPTALNPNS